MKYYWMPISIGLLAYFLASFLTVIIIPYMLVSANDFAYQWYTQIAFSMSKVTLIIPGLVAGYMFNGSGIRIGTVVGSLSGISVAFYPSLTGMIPWVFDVSFLPEVIAILLLNAVSGGCGELIRIKKMNKRKLP